MNETKETKVIYFGSSRCGVCVAVEPGIKKLADMYGMLFEKISIEEKPEISGQHLVFTVPTVIVLFEGREILRESGFIDFENLKKTLSRISEFA